MCSCYLVAISNLYVRSIELLAEDGINFRKSVTEIRGKQVKINLSILDSKMDPIHQAFFNEFVMIHINLHMWCFWRQTRGTGDQEQLLKVLA